MNIDKKMLDSADDAIINLSRKLCDVIDERDEAITNKKNMMSAFVDMVDTYCADIKQLKDLLYKKNGEITDLHTRINSLEHLLDLARSKND